MIRIDPLTEDGKFDSDFFGEKEYYRYRARVEWYIKQEGFDAEPQTYILSLMDHYWQIQITPFNV